MEYYKKKLAQKKAGINIDNNNDSNYSKVMYDYKNIFDYNGGKIPEYKVYAKNYKNKEKNKFIKKSKLNGIIIVEHLKDYLPKDISRDEIQELIFEAFGDNIVEDEDLIIPGQTASYDQVLQLCDYVFNYIKGNEKKMKENNALQNLNIKIDLVSLDQKLIKDKVYKEKDLIETTKSIKMNNLFIKGTYVDLYIQSTWRQGYIIEMKSNNKYDIIYLSNQEQIKRKNDMPFSSLGIIGDNTNKSENIIRSRCLNNIIF